MKLHIVMDTFCGRIVSHILSKTISPALDLGIVCPWLNFLPVTRLLLFYVLTIFQCEVKCVHF